MSENTRLIMVTVSITLISIALLVLLLLIFIFPAVNRLFGTKLPGIRWGSGRGEPDAQDLPAQEELKSPKRSGRKTVPSKEQPAKSGKGTKPKAVNTQLTAGPTARPVVRVSAKRSAASAKSEPSLPAAQKKRKKKSESAAQSPLPGSRVSRAPDLHKHIPTVRVDTIFAPKELQKPLSAAKIDAEGKRAGKPEPQNPAAAAEKPSGGQNSLTEKPRRKKKSDGNEPDTVEIG